MALRISVTQIESFRYFLENDYVSQDTFINELVCKTAPSRNMQLGTAYHSILENPSKYEMDCFYTCDFHLFRKEDIEKSIKVIDYSFPFEVKKVKIIGSKYGFINLVAKVDQLCGTYITENKTRWSKFEWEKYHFSCQRKFYSDIFEIEKVKYNVFEMSDTKSRGLELVDIHTFTFYTKPSEIIEAYDLLNKFLDFIYEHNLDSYFEEKKKLQVA